MTILWHGDVMHELRPLNARQGIEAGLQAFSS